MSALGQSRRFQPARAMSALLPVATGPRTCWLVRSVPIADMNITPAVSVLEPEWDFVGCVSVLFALGQT
jgi:hypothetical protein